VPIISKGRAIRGGKITIDGSLSSQFISALLLACPQLAEDSTVHLTGGQLVSSDYIVMTQQILKKAGVRIVQKSVRQYLIKGNQSFKGLGTFAVPSDYGLSAFHMAAAALVTSNIVLKGNFDDHIQADGHIIPMLRKMGVRFVKTKKSISVQGPFSLKGGRFSLKDCPDLLPIMAILALFAKGKTALVDVKHARVKESNRITDLRHELLKVGAKVTEKEDEMIIQPQKSYKNNCLLDPHHDHRLAMAFSVLGLKVGVRIKDIECTRKSYPDFVQDFKKLGAAVKF
jgi:3-phosphoshikimate 1-carboxyvinyltransferase